MIAVMSVHAPSSPLAGAAARGGARPFIHKEGRKLNGEYFIIKVHELGGDSTRLLYRAYSPRCAAGTLT